MKLPESKLTKRQVKKVVITTDDEKLVIRIRHDDSCGNGHNTFSITGDLYSRIEGTDKWRSETCGMVHEDIARLAPELKPLLKWHMCATDGPLHYLANTLYFASDKDCWGRRKGEPSAWDYVLVVGSVGVIVEVPKLLWQWLRTSPKCPLTVLPVEHLKEPEKYEPCYTFDGFEASWGSAPFEFDKRYKAQNLADIINSGAPIRFEKRPVAFSKGKVPELEAARRAAIWPDATLEQLQNKELLEARLPSLMQEFKEVVESLGFTY